jgi:plasmid maintenance system antidote protein VapI
MTTEPQDAAMKTFPNIHPGEVLLEEFLLPLNISPAALGTSERFWLGLQADYDLEQAHRALGAAVMRIERLAA